MPQNFFPNTVRTILKIAIFCGLMVFAYSPQSLAQQSNTDDRIRQLETQLQTISKYVYRGEGVAPADIAASNSASAGTVAAFESRLSDLEEQVRQMRGQMEEINFRQDQLVRQLNDNQAVLQQRFAAYDNILQLQPAANAAQTPFQFQDGGGAAAAPATELSSTGISGGVVGEAASSAVSTTDSISGVMSSEWLKPEGAATTNANPNSTVLPLVLPVPAVKTDGPAPAPAPAAAIPAPTSTATTEAAISEAEPSTDAAANAATGASAEALVPTDATATTPEAWYAQSFDLLSKAEYNAAEIAFTKFLEKYPENELSANAAYWLAETFYVRGDLSQAAVSFAKTYKDYPSGQKAPDTLLKLAASLHRIDRTKDACLTLTELNTKFPKASASVLSRAEQLSETLKCGQE